MMFTPASLSRIRIPLLLLRAERTPLYTLQHAERLLSAMPQPPQLGVLPDADTASLMSSCGGNLDQTLPEMWPCRLPLRAGRPYRQNGRRIRRLLPQIPRNPQPSTASS